MPTARSTQTWTGRCAPLTAEIERLEPQCQRVRQLFVQRGVEPAATSDAVEACVQLLADERLRAEFDVALRAFLNTFDTVLPRPEALPFVNDITLFAEIQIRTRRRYRDTPDGDFDPHKYKEKIRRLIDQHITALDLSQKIAPARITDPEFRNSTGQIGSVRAKASEMEHAVRHHIREHLHEDPAYYERLSQRIDDILDRLQERWEQMALEFEELIADIKAGRTDEDNTGLDPRHGVALPRPDGRRGHQLQPRRPRQTRRLHGCAGGRDPPNHQRRRLLGQRHQARRAAQDHQALPR